MLSEVGAYYMTASYSVHVSPCKTILQLILLHRCRLALCLMSVCRRTPVRVLLSAHEPDKAKVIEHPSSLRLASCPTSAQYHEWTINLIPDKIYTRIPPVRIQSYLTLFLPGVSICYQSVVTRHYLHYQSILSHVYLVISATELKAVVY